MDGFGGWKNYRTKQYWKGGMLKKDRPIYSFFSAKVELEEEMSDRDPRKMAAQIAAVRASETHLPEDERVFNDPYAEFFLPDEMRAGLNDVDEIRAAISRYEQMMGDPFTRCSTSCKQRFRTAGLRTDDSGK
jgi:hypothetical protein